MGALEDYINEKVDEELRKHCRWLVDCQWCGKPLRTHGEKCVFDPDQCQFRGIESVL